MRKRKAFRRASAEAALVNAYRYGESLRRAGQLTEAYTYLDGVFRQLTDIEALHSVLGSDVLNSIGLIVAAWGQRDEAEEWLRESLDLTEELQGRSLSWAITNDNIAALLHGTSRLQEARDRHLEALAIFQVQPNSSDHVRCLLNLVEVEGALDDEQDAWRHATEAHAVAKQYGLPELDLTTIRLAQLARRAGNRDRARYLLSSVDSPSTAEIAEWLLPEQAMLAEDEADVAAALDAWEQVWRSDRAAVRDECWYWRFGEDHVERVHRSAAWMLSVAFRANELTPSALRQVFTVVLNTCGLLTAIERNRMFAIGTSADVAIRELYDDARTSALESYENSFAGPGYQSIQEWNAWAAADAERLGRATSAIGNALRPTESLLPSEVSLERVTEALPEDSALLLFMRVDFPAGLASEAEYVAFTVLKGEPSSLSMSRLGPAKVLDEAATQFISKVGRRHVRGFRDAKLLDGSTAPVDAAAAADTALLGSLIAPVFRQLRGVERLIVKADSFLNVVPWCALPIEIEPASEPVRVLDRHAIVSISGVWDLFRRPAAAKTGPVFTLGDPDCDAGRLFPDASTDVGPISRLSHAQEESRLIAELFSTSSVTGGDATKQSVMQQISPAVLHIAAHGFYFDEWTPLAAAVSPPGDSSGPIFAMNPTVSYSDPERMIVELSSAPITRQEWLMTNRPRYAMLRSGLALVGANAWLRSETMSIGAGTGFLTAAEFAWVDLRGTDLVVMSACETGLGDVRSFEGPYGLGRAAQVAGALGVMGTLWTVDDASTSELVVAALRLFAAGAYPFDALRQAQLAMKKKRADPYFWAAFGYEGQPLVGSPKL